MTTLFDAGDALRGYRVAITARRLSKPAVVSESGRHKANLIICPRQRLLRNRNASNR